MAVVAPLPAARRAGGTGGGRFYAVNHGTHRNGSSDAVPLGYR
jgi:hypothetical protein